MKIEDTIKIDEDDSSEMSCGMKYCPYHQWTRIANDVAPIDSICTLPGNGGNVLYLAFPGAKNNETKYKIGGATYVGGEETTKMFED